MTAGAGDRAELEREVARELDRVVDRLDSMPLARAAASTDAVLLAAEELVEQGRRLGVPVPPGATVPRLQPHGLGALIAVLGRDCLDAARASRDPDLGPVRDALVSLRRALP